MFLTSLDDEGQWYQYHHLFADLLHQRLLENQAGTVSLLYLKASQWFEQEGLLAEAIEYALRGEHFEHATALIEQAAELTVKRSEIATFKRWVERVPVDLVRSSASLSIFYAWVLLISDGNPQEARAYIDGIVPEDEGIDGRLKTVKSMLAMYQRQIPEAITLARRALEELPEEDLFFRHIAAWNLSALLYISGAKEEGRLVLEELTEVSRQSGNRLVAVVALCRLALVRMQSGELFKPEALFLEALELATDAQGNKVPVACEALIGLAYHPLVME